ncbi:MAG: YgeY family selenium metabolism-linked hydrolase [Deltaproteobacteria bacterium]|jgi:putative selenium metabolism hydrolase|nr:YgeY family selenium metabolism-linked hydrolase [Deltaproteobacteria bacterium]
MKINFKEVLKRADEYESAISRFLRDMIAIPSESRQEAKVIQRIKEEMETVGFDRVDIDPMGNILGYIGNGRHLIAMDAHVDTVGVGDPDQWEYDPYKGYEDDEIIVGRGASDQEGGMAAMVYAGKIIKDMHLEEDYTLLITGTIQEEDCDGLCWQYIINENKIRPEFVVSTEPTSCRVYRGQRGRMEIKVATTGVSCHGSAPERGDNAIFKMAPILNELQVLHTRLEEDDFLGKGSLTVSEIFSSSPSRCAVADGCWISIDRRLIAGETGDQALQQIRDLPAVKEVKAQVSMYTYGQPSYTGLVYPTDSYFPAWILEENHPACQTLVTGYKHLFGEDPVVDKWTFSTNGVAITGMSGIPCIGFGPGHEDQAHAPNEKTWKSELVQSAAMYAVIPAIYVQQFVR